ncbi:hypothetical protein LWI28_009563 [Acer negundo]|uniref:Uncharacterized protein n=1 Tax=Acer negundo TaxID=4023 RepID=A0AAD5I905_ACENE|nr:hypothetical protein LWI28_009563 [Acer negundo]
MKSCGYHQMTALRSVSLLRNDDGEATMSGQEVGVPDHVCQEHGTAFVFSYGVVSMTAQLYPLCRRNPSTEQTKVLRTCHRQCPSSSPLSPPFE